MDEAHSFSDCRDGDREPFPLRCCSRCGSTYYEEERALVFPEIAFADRSMCVSCNAGLGPDRSVYSEVLTPNGIFLAQVRRQIVRSEGPREHRLVLQAPYHAAEELVGFADGFWLIGFSPLGMHEQFVDGSVAELICLPQDDDLIDLATMIVRGVLPDWVDARTLVEFVVGGETGFADDEVRPTTFEDSAEVPF